MTTRRDNLDLAILRALAVERVDAFYADVVRGYVLDRTDTWRQCCGSSCDPCILQLGRIVDEVRSSIEPSSAP